MAAAEAGESGATEKYNNLIKKLQEAAADEDGNPSTTTDEDALIKEVMDKIINKHLSENADLKAAIIEEADKLLPLVKNYAKALCDLRNAKEAVERTNRMPLAADDEEPYHFEGNFSYYLDRINSTKEALQADIDELEEYLTVAAGDEQGDDMYKKYLALKALAGNAAEAQALLDEYDHLPSPVQNVVSATPDERKANKWSMVKALSADEKALYDSYRDAYCTWSNQMENGAAISGWVFDYIELQTATELDLTEADALFPNITEDNIDQPSKFKAAVDKATEEAERIAQIYEDYENAAEALAEDAHAQAYFDKVTYGKTEHYFTSLWSDRNMEEDQQVGRIELKYTGETKSVDGGNYYEIKVYGLNITRIGAEHSIEKGTYWVDQLDIDEYPYIYSYDETNEEMIPLFDLSATDNGQLYIDWDSWRDSYAESTNDYYPDYTTVTGVEPLYGAGENDTDIDERDLVKNMIDAKIALMNKGLDLDDADEAKEAAEEARDKANNWFVAWYTQADEIFGQSSSFDITYDKEMQKLFDQDMIAKLDEVLAALMAIEDPYDGESACQKYLDAVAALGTPAVEDDEETTEVDETAAATGAYLAVDNAKAAKDDQVDVLKGIVNGIDDTASANPARLNIIWNDGSANVTGIMEAVVKRTATEAGDNTIYNLNGMRVKNAGKGIFIQNGKKVIK